MIKRGNRKSTMSAENESKSLENYEKKVRQNWLPPVTVEIVSDSKALMSYPLGSPHNYQFTIKAIGRQRDAQHMILLSHLHHKNQSTIECSITYLPHISTATASSAFFISSTYYKNLPTPTSACLYISWSWTQHIDNYMC